MWPVHPNGFLYGDHVFLRAYVLYVAGHPMVIQNKRFSAIYSKYQA